jgi:hypothetical protein
MLPTTRNALHAKQKFLVRYSELDLAIALVQLAIEIGDLF